MGAPAPRTWEDLAADAVAGDAVAQRDLARLAIARVRRQAVFMGARGKDLEGAVRTALEDAFGALATFRDQGPFVTWLDRVAARVLLGQASRWSPRGADGPRGGDARERVERATRRLARLDPERRLAVILTAAGGYDPEEVCAVLGGAPATSRARVERARRELEAGDEGETGLEAVATGGDDALLDALTERRVERAALAALERAPSAAPAPTARPRRWAWAALGAVAAALALLLVAAVLWPSGPPSPRPRLDAVVALAAGGATIAGAPARAGRWVGAGAAFQVPAGGRLALGLGDGTLLHAGPGAKGGVDAWTVADARVRLDAGTVVARVARGRPGRRFTVRTSDVVVRASPGAVFAITHTSAHAAGEPSSVRVLRGDVQADARAAHAKSLRLAAGDVIFAGSSAPHPLLPAHAAADWALAGRGAIAVHGAPVRVETTPPGAAVSLAGEPVGKTPLTILARPGPAALLVERADHAPVREEIELRAGEPLRRRFTLFPLVVRATHAP